MYSEETGPKEFRGINSVKYTSLKENKNAKLYLNILIICDICLITSLTSILFSQFYVYERNGIFKLFTLEKSYYINLSVILFLSTLSLCAITAYANYKFALVDISTKRVLRIKNNYIIFIILVYIMTSIHLLYLITEIDQILIISIINHIIAIVVMIFDIFRLDELKNT